MAFPCHALPCAVHEKYDKIFSEVSNIGARVTRVMPHYFTWDAYFPDVHMVRLRACHRVRGF